MTHKQRKRCILCRSYSLLSVLELPETPPANELVKKDFQELIPISLLLCSDCGHLQLKEIVFLIDYLNYL